MKRKILEIIAVALLVVCVITRALYRLPHILIKRRKKHG